MSLWLTLAVNSIALGGLLFLLSSGFSLIFGLMRIPNLMHGSFFMLGAYLGVTLLARGVNFWVAALMSAAALARHRRSDRARAAAAACRRSTAASAVDLGCAFIVADLCLMLWTGDPWQPGTPEHLRGVVQVAGLYFPLFRLVIVAVAVVDGDRALAAGRLDAARRQDPRRRR